MWARKRLDIGWFDLGYATLCCCLPGQRAERQRCIESLWSGSGDTLACLSVRSGFDLLLEALALSPGSEVLVSALTIKDMVRIIDEHGLVAVPVDLEPGAMAPDLDSLRQAITPATRAILVAHLFGGRIDLEPIVRLAEEHGLLVIEDCAQAYVGPHFVGHPGVAASMFSFGPIKTATALGGALIRVADPALVEAMRRLQRRYPVQGRWAFFRRAWKYGLLKLTSLETPYGLFVGMMRLLGQDHDRLVNGAVRGFAGPGFFPRIRQQPCAPLLALLVRRLRKFEPARLAARAAVGQRLVERLADKAPCPGADAPLHSHWVLPLLADDPAGLIAALGHAGFDATQGQSLCVVDPPADRPQLDPRWTRQTVEHLVYLPCYPEIPSREVARMAVVVLDELARVSGDGPPVEKEGGKGGAGDGAKRRRRAWRQALLGKPALAPSERPFDRQSARKRSRLF